MMPRGIDKGIILCYYIDNSIILWYKVDVDKSVNCCAISCSRYVDNGYGGVGV